MSILKSTLIERFELRFDGVFPLDESEAADWKRKRDWALAIIRRNATYITPLKRFKGGARFPRQPSTTQTR
jgi:hypothetical protein